MLNDIEINEIIKDCKKSGHDIKVRDIAFIILCSKIDDNKIAYEILFGNSENYNEYIELPEIKFLDTYIKENRKLSTRTKEEEMTFQENKKAIEELIKEAKTMYDNGELDANQYLQRTKDLRINLNDKFNIKDDHKEQYVIVEQKYNDVCPYCHHEISIKSKQ